jgi:hypothetical protein
VRALTCVLLRIAVERAEMNNNILMLPFRVSLRGYTAIIASRVLSPGLGWAPRLGLRRYSRAHQRETPADGGCADGSGASGGDGAATATPAVGAPAARPVGAAGGSR